MKNQTNRFSWKARGKSFVYALSGLKYLVGEHNAWIHCAATGAVIGVGAVIGLSTMEWCTIIICIGMVLAAEGINTSIEALCDLVSEEYAPLIKKSKDVAAGAVLILALVSITVGLIIFLPKLYNLI